MRTAYVVNRQTLDVVQAEGPASIPNEVNFKYRFHDDPFDPKGYINPATGFSWDEKVPVPGLSFQPKKGKTSYVGDPQDFAVLFEAGYYFTSDEDYPMFYFSHRKSSAIEFEVYRPKNEEVLAVIRAMDGLSLEILAIPGYALFRAYGRNDIEDFRRWVADISWIEPNSQNLCVKDRL